MKSMLSTLKFFLTVCLCAMVMVSTLISMPSAMATPIKGEATEPAKTYEAKAKETIDQGGLQSLEEVRDRASGGAPNEVQGTAGLEGMKRPSNSSGETIEAKIKKGLDKVEGKANDTMEQINKAD